MSTSPGRSRAEVTRISGRPLTPAQIGRPARAEDLARMRRVAVFWAQQEPSGHQFAEPERITNATRALRSSLWERVADGNVS